MPYRLRLYSGDQLLVTTGHESSAEAGQRVAEFPLGELGDDEGASLRREVTFVDATGRERPATEDEESEVFEAMSQRMAEISAAEVEPCPRCGLRAPEQEEAYPVRLTPAGPVCFGCWTDEEHKQLG